MVDRFRVWWVRTAKTHPFRAALGFGWAFAIVTWWPLMVLGLYGGLTLKAVVLSLIVGPVFVGLYNVLCARWDL